MSDEVPPIPPEGWWIRKRVLGRQKRFSRSAPTKISAPAEAAARADGAHGGADELDHVMDHVARFDMAAGGRDQHVDRLVAVLGQRQQMRDGALRQLVVDRAGDDHRARTEIQPVDRGALRQAQFFALLPVLAPFILVVVVIVVIQAVGRKRAQHGSSFQRCGGTPGTGPAAVLPKQPLRISK